MMISKFLVGLIKVVQVCPIMTYYGSFYIAHIKIMLEYVLKIKQKKFLKTRVAYSTIVINLYQ